METYLALRRAKTMALKLLRMDGGHLFWRQKNDGHAGFGLFFSLLLMLSLEMAKMMVMKARCAG
jgi:hypothetical protein